MACPSHPSQTEGEKCPKCGSKIEAKAPASVTVASSRKGK